jgi:alpha-D-xyloside xylohydrolase
LFRKKIPLALALLAAASALAQRPAAEVRRDAQGVTLTTGTAVTRVEIWSSDAIRVIHRNAGTAPAASLVVTAKPGKVEWKFADQAGEIVLSTAKVRVEVEKATGAVRFLDKQGAVILAESAGGTSLQAATVGGTATLAVAQSFALDSDEAIYGLGQHPDGVMNYAGTSVHLQQKNRDVAVPVLLSSNGYAVLWDNAAVTDVDAGKTDRSRLTWTSEAGRCVDYYFLYGPEPDEAIGAYRELTGAAPMFGKWAWGFWQCKQRYHSQEQLLDTVAQYRQMQVPIDGIIQDWLYWYPGAWGSHQFDKTRYPDPVGMMKQLHEENVHLLISVWPKFDADSPNATALRDGGDLYPEVISYVYPPGKGQWYDPFKASARELYWQQISKELFADGVDGWWLDASEPELSGKWGEYRNFQTGAGPGAEVFNAFPLMHTTAVYEGQRKENSEKRVFILTRSAYAGQQRNAAVTWSGDIRGSWAVFAKQIPAGINFMLTGIPYWNTDTGGFFGGNPLDPKYAELFTRWFQFSAFCPMFRVHGSATEDAIEPTQKDKPGKEMWQFPPDTQKVLIDYDKLRYHLLPYIYSVAWMVTHENSTMMRGLVMDFRSDPKVYNIPDQYMFGPALMVNPVTQAGAQSREVYLPAGTSWTDFWTGETSVGGETVEAAAAIQEMPLFVRAGSIIPYGPEIQYAAAKADPIELRVYPGADGSLTLYEDEGDNYNYEKGVYATIPMRWNEKSQTLTIGERRGEFPGMLKERTFRVVFVKGDHGTGIASSAKADAEVRYSGKAVEVRRGGL